MRRACIVALLALIPSTASAQVYQQQILAAPQQRSPNVPLGTSSNCTLSAPGAWSGSEALQSSPNTVGGPYSTLGQLGNPGAVPLLASGTFLSVVANLQYGAPLTTLSCPGQETCPVPPPSGSAATDTANILHALALACPVAGAGSYGPVLLGSGTYKVNASLLMQCTNEALEGRGADGTFSSIGPSTAIQWEGAVNGTIIREKAPAANDPNDNLVGVIVTSVSLEGGTGACTAVEYESIWYSRTLDVSYDLDFGSSNACTTAIFWWHEDPNMALGNDNIDMERMRGENFNETEFWLEQGYSNFFSDFRTVQDNNEMFLVGGLTAATDESDTNLFQHFVNVDSGTGITFDFSCNSSADHIYDFSGGNITVRGTATCPGGGLNVSAINTVYSRYVGDQDSTPPTVEAGGELVVQDDGGNTSVYLPGPGNTYYGTEYYNSTISNSYHVTNAPFVAGPAGAAQTFAIVANPWDTGTVLGTDFGSACGPSTNGAWLWGVGGSSSSSAADGCYALDYYGNFWSNNSLNSYSVYAAPAASAANCNNGFSFGAASYNSAPSGVTIYSGSGAPTCAAANGSMYLRSDGGVGTHLYITSGGGVWVAVAAV